jgi:SOS-response transcriptional repressor LexA
MTATATDRPRPLTKRQRQILDEVTRFQSEHGYCTSVRELMRKFGWASPNAVTSHLRALRQRGLVTWEPGVARTLRPTGDAT